GLSRRTRHYSSFFGLSLKGDGTRGIDDQFKEHHMNRHEQQGPSQKEGNQCGSRNRNVNRENEARGLLKVVVNAPALAYGGHDGRELVVEQDQRGGLASHIRATVAHGDPDVGGFEGRRVVHAIAGHGHNLTGGLESRDDPELLLRDHTGENVNSPSALL